MTTVLVPKAVESTRTSEYAYRVLFLTGTWRKPGSDFRFRATIYVQKDGAAEGSIYWRAIRTHGMPACYFATECVRGFVSGRNVELDGQAVEPGLSPDSYRITLSGTDKEGPFSGISRTYFNNWCGRMEGAYVFRNRKA